MNDNASTSTLATTQSLPHFASVHSNYTRRLLQGRHPRSFPRQSELWHHYKASSTRLARVVKGHHLWNILDEHTEHVDQHPQSSQDNANLNQQTHRLDSAAGGKHARDPWNGIRVDTKGVFRLHYGMNCVLVNSLDEVLCVNHLDEIVCKPCDQLSSSDQICFKLFDLLEPTNPGPIEYGRNLWLQILRSPSRADEPPPLSATATNSSLSAATSAAGGGSSSHGGGSVLAAKLFGPPEMTSAQLNEMEQLRLRSDKPKHSNSSHSNKHTSLIADALQNTGGACATATVADTGDISKGTDQSEICGLLSVVRIFADKNGQSSVRHGAADGGTAADAHVTNTAEGRFRSKQAWHLGQWTVQNAMRVHPEENYLSSCSPVYLEQDLYCLATSHGNKFRPWPWTNHRRQQQQKQRGSVVGGASIPFASRAVSSRGGSRPGTGDSTLSSAGLKISNDKSGLTHAKVQQPSDMMMVYQGARGCLRRVVKRGPPYEHLVDRRCVWRFMVADNPRDLKMLSVKEQKAQKLLRKADAGLNASKNNRLGSRIHKNLQYTGQPLVGGEMFPRMLRGIVAGDAFKREETDLKFRRRKEEELTSHFREIYEKSRIGTSNAGGSRENQEKYSGKNAQILRITVHDNSQLQDAISSPMQTPEAAAVNSALHTSLTSRAVDATRKLSSLGQIDAAIPSSDDNANSNVRSFGRDVLSLHRTFVTVNNKVTVNLSKPRASISQVDTMMYGSDASGAGANVVAESPQFKQIRMSQKMEQLAEEDERVQSALRYRERLMRRNEMASLFENSADFDITDIRA